jgi:hypothetical protein
VVLTVSHGRGHNQRICSVPETDVLVYGDLAKYLQAMLNCVFEALVDHVVVGDIAPADNISFRHLFFDSAERGTAKRTSNFILFVAWLCCYNHLPIYPEAILSCHVSSVGKLRRLNGEMTIEDRELHPRTPSAGRLITLVENIFSFAPPVGCLIFLVVAPITSYLLNTVPDIRPPLGISREWFPAVICFFVCFALDSGSTAGLCGNQQHVMETKRQ